MKLYSVELSATVYVVAEDSRAAEWAALAERRDIDWDLSAHEVTNRREVDPEWLDVEPFGMGSEPARTVGEFADEAEARAFEAKHQLRLFEGPAK